MGTSKVELVRIAIWNISRMLKDEMLGESNFRKKLKKKEYKKEILKVESKLKIFEETLIDLILKEEVYQNNIIIDLKPNGSLVRAMQKADININMLPEKICIEICEYSIDFNLF